MSNLYVNTTQNIRLFFNTASIGERMLAYLVDTAIKVAYLLMLFFTLISALPDEFFNNFKELQVVVLTLALLPVVLYSFICEATMSGQTFGKKLLKIRVIKIDGYRASVFDYFTRWLFAIVDIDLGYLPGLISMIATKHTQRLGDLAAGTAVISEKAKYNLNHTILQNVGTDYRPYFQRSQLMRFTDNDMRIIKEHAQQAMKRNDQQLMERISQKILSVMDITNPFADDAKLFDTLLNDYNFYTGAS